MDQNHLEPDQSGVHQPQAGPPAGPLVRQTPPSRRNRSGSLVDLVLEDLESTPDPNSLQR